MCGISGVLSGEPVDIFPVEMMRDSLAHRGPDHAGVWSSQDGRVGMGSRRLAVIDPEPEADQPFVSADGRFVLVYNGEIYNFRDLRRELRQEGADLRKGFSPELGNDPSLAELADLGLVEELQRAHRDGDSDEPPRIHALYILNRWLRRWG